MRFFTVLSITILSFQYIPAQDSAQVSIPLEIFDNAGGEKTLFFGFDSTATDSIDPDLGEFELPPAPPTGIFDARFILPPGNFSEIGSWRDYRYGIVPFEDSVYYRLKYQATENSDTLYIRWNFPTGITAHLQDLVTGSEINEFLSDSGTFGFSNFDLIDQLKFTVFFNLTPVEIISFLALVDEYNVIIKWNTITETNNRGFEIEREDITTPSGAIYWKKIGYISGFGTTSKVNSYSFIDNNVHVGKYLYRLKQIDFDGNFKYSQNFEIIVNNPENFELEQNYPNPFNPTTVIKFQIPHTSNVSLKIYNSLGQLVKTLVNDQLKKGIYSVIWDGSDNSGNKLSSGVYFNVMDTGIFLLAHKMILMK